MSVGVAVVVVAATVDAVRRQDEAPGDPSATSTLAGRNVLAVELERLGARGELVLYGDGCSAQVLELPSLNGVDDGRTCSPRGVVSPDGSLVAVCPGDETRTFSATDGGLVRALPGCAPAWRPDGTLTVAYERSVVRFFPACHAPNACMRTLIPRGELVRAARRHPTGPALAPLRVLVDGVAWLSNARAAVLMSIRLTGRFAGMGPLSAIAFFENGRLTKTQPYFRVTGGRLGVSPRGSYVTQTPDVILRPDGSQVSLPEYLRDTRDFAWSSDERLLALAGQYAVTIVDVASLERYDRTGGGLRSVTLPQPAVRLSWR